MINLQNDFSCSSNFFAVSSSYLSAGDCTKGCEFLAQAFIVNGIIQVLHIQIDSLVSRERNKYNLYEILYNK